MNKLYKFACLMLTGVALIVTTSCSDPDDEIKTANLSRLLRPAGLELKIEDKTTIKATMDFVTKPDYVDVTIEVNDNPLAVDKTFKPLKSYTITSPADAKNDHVTMSTTITGLTYFKDYRVSFTARDKSGKVSNPSTAIATTDGIFKESDDDDRTNNSLTVKWPSEIIANKIKVAKFNGTTEETVSEESVDPSAAKYTKTGLNPDTEYIFYVYNDDDCLGRYTFTTFPNYTELFAGDEVDIAGAIDNLDEGDAIMLSPSTEGISEFTYANEKTITLTKSARIIGRNTKPVTVKNLKFKLDGCTGLTIENVGFNGSGNFVEIVKGKTASGDYIFHGLEITGFERFMYYNNATASTALASNLNLIEVKNCYFHKGLSTGLFDLRNLGIKDDPDKSHRFLVNKITVEQNTFSETSNGKNFIRLDFCVNKMTFANNSIYAVKSTESKGMFYIRSYEKDVKDYDCAITSNIFEACGAGVFYANNSQINALSFNSKKKNYYKNCDDLMQKAAEGMLYDTEGTTYTGKSAFKDPNNSDEAQKDFTIVNSTLKNAGVGNTEFVKK